MTRRKIKLGKTDELWKIIVHQEECFLEWAYDAGRYRQLLGEVVSQEAAIK